MYDAIPWDVCVGLHRFTVHYLGVHVYSTLLGSAGVKLHYITWGCRCSLPGVQVCSTYLGVQVYSKLPGGVSVQYTNWDAGVE